MIHCRKKNLPEPVAEPCTAVLHVRNLCGHNVVFGRVRRQFVTEIAQPLIFLGIVSRYEGMPHSCIFGEKGIFSSYKYTCM